jgi:hypothetical protein
MDGSGSRRSSSGATMMAGLLELLLLLLRLLLVFTFAIVECDLVLIIKALFKKVGRKKVFAEERRFRSIIFCMGCGL